MSETDPDAVMLGAMASGVERQLTRVFRLFRRRLLEEARARGLTMAQNTALRLLSGGAERRMSELADHLDLTNGATTALIEKLVERGLAERLEDPHDKRAVLVRLSPAGKALVDEVTSHLLGLLVSRLAGMSPAERYMVAGGIEALAASLFEP